MTQRELVEMLHKFEDASDAFYNLYDYVADRLLKDMDEDTFLNDQDIDNQEDN